MKHLVFLLFLGCAMASAKSKADLRDTSVMELQMACSRLHAAKDLRDGWELDFKQATEKWLEVKKIERAFEALESCQERTDSLHQTIARIETLLSKEESDAEKDLDNFSSEAHVCKSKEKADRLVLVLKSMRSRVEELKRSADEAAALYKKEVAISEVLESLRKLPAEIDPKVESMKELLANALRARKTLQKKLDEVLNQEKASTESEPCDKKSAFEWLAENERITSQIKEMIDKAIGVKPVLVTALKCKPNIDTALIEKTNEYPKTMSASIETRRGDFVVQRCFQTAAFYDEVSQTIVQGEQANQQWIRMKEKEADDNRRTSLPTQRKQAETTRQIAETASQKGEY